MNIANANEQNIANAKCKIWRKNVGEIFSYAKKNNNNNSGLSAGEFSTSV